MNIAWEKLVMWIIAIIVIIIIIAFIVTQLSPGGEGIVGRIFGDLGSATDSAAP